MDTYQDTIFTTGDDNCLYEWSIDNRKCTKHTELLTTQEYSRYKNIRDKQTRKLTASTMAKTKPEYCARGVVVNENLKHVVTAMLDGKIVIRNIGTSKDRSIHKVLLHPKEWCEVLEFSPNFSKLAVGSHDNNIYIYDAENDYAFVGKCNSHHSYIMALDWDEQSKYIRTNSGDYELLFFDIESAMDDSSKTIRNDPAGASNTRNTQWHTQYCKLGWAVQGIYPPGEDGTHVNGVDCLFSENLLLTADDYGLINLFNYPCLEENMYTSKSFCGHSEHVVRARFIQDGKYIVSIGGYDQTVLLWKRNE